jgi:hypothetical protein
VIRLSHAISDRNLKKNYGLALIYAITLVGIYYFQSHYTNLMALFSKVFPLFSAGVAVVASSFALRIYWENLESILSRIWLGFSLGMIFWFIGELGWAICTLIFGIELSYPSVADVYRLVGYGFFFFAIFTYIKLFRSVISTKVLATASIFMLPTSVGIIPPLLLSVGAKASVVNPTTLFVGLAYPFLDLMLLTLAMLGLLVFTTTRLKGRLGSVWLLINAGIIMNAFGDMLFSYTNLQNTYYNGHPLELFFHLGYLFFILSFYAHTKKL